MWPLLPIAVAVFCMSALVYYHVWEGGSTQARSLLQAAVIAIYEAIGFMPAFLLCALGLVWSSIWFLGGALAEPKVRVAKVAGCTVALAIWINLRGAGEVAGTHTGAFGNAIATRLVEAIGFVPSALLLAPLTLVLFLLATDFLFYRYFDELWVPRERKAVAATGVAEDGGVGHAEAEIFKSLAQAEEAERAAHEAAVAEAAIRETRSSWRERRRRWRESEDPAAAIAPPAEPVAGAQFETARVEAEVVASVEVSFEPPAESVASTEVEAEVEVPVAREPVAESGASDVLDAPVAPSDDGVGAFAQAEGVIAEEIGSTTDEVRAGAELPAHEVEPARAEPQAAVVAETVSEEDVARELGVGEADEPAVPAEAHASVDESAFAAETDEESEAELDEPAAERTVELVVEVADAPVFEPEEAEEAEATLEAEPVEESEPEEVPASVADAEPVEPPAEEPVAAAGGVEEPVVEIPRPSEDALRQGSLFGLKRGDDPLVAEAIDLIQQSGRASASFLQRKLRVDFGTASQLLLILAERGVIELDADQSQGRLLR